MEMVVCREANEWVNAHTYTYAHVHARTRAEDAHMRTRNHTHRFGVDGHHHAILFLGGGGLN